MARRAIWELPELWLWSSCPWEPWWGGGVGGALPLLKLHSSSSLLSFSAQLFAEKQMVVKHQSLLLQKPSFSRSQDCFREMFRSFWRAVTIRTFWVPSFIQWVPCSLGLMGLPCIQFAAHSFCATLSQVVAEFFIILLVLLWLEPFLCIFHLSCSCTNQCIELLGS